MYQVVHYHSGHAKTSGSPGIKLCQMSDATKRPRRRGQGQWEGWEWGTGSGLLHVTVAAWCYYAAAKTCLLSSLIPSGLVKSGEVSPVERGEEV